MREGGECRKRGALEVSGGGTGTPWGCGDMGSGGAGGGGDHMEEVGVGSVQPQL